MSNVISMDKWRRKNDKNTLMESESDDALESFRKVLDGLEEDLFKDAIEAYGNDVAKIAEVLNRSESEIAEYMASKGYK